MENNSDSSECPENAKAAIAEGISIGGFEPFTTQDFPGHLAAVVFCNGCPWRCSYCHNKHLLKKGVELEWHVIYSFLKDRESLLEAVVFSGGEPLVHPGIVRAMAQIKQDTNYLIGLHTNGLRPDRFKDALKYLDWVGLDIKGMLGDYEKITGKAGSGEAAWESLKILLESGVDYEIRTTPDVGYDDVSYLTGLMEGLSAMGVKKYVIQNRRGRNPTSLTDRAFPSGLFETFYVRPT